MKPAQYDVASVADLADGGKLQADVDGTPVLLVRTGSRIHAVGALCPHAGAPLAEGLLHGDRLVCPWHKATFCLRTGAVLEPPALDPLPLFEVESRDGRILVTATSPTTPGTPPGTDPRLFVVVGGGAAGATAAQTLREVGFAGRLVLLDAEGRVPYDRTVLSKYALSGRKGAEKSPLQSQAFYKSHGIERRQGRVTILDPVRRRIACADGSVLDYDSALLATGCRPIRPDLPGSTLGNVFVLRSKADAEAILAQAERSEAAVILGASFIGMEVAASLKERGLDVTVVARDTAPFDKVLGPRIGTAFRTLHERHGVRFRLGSIVEALDGDDRVRSITLAGGETLAADLVVIGFGGKPATDFLQGIALGRDGGIPVDASLKVTDGLFAAGDIASFPVYGTGETIRVEHWRVAEQHGRVAALGMVGQQARYVAPPMFWTIQYLKRLDYIGHAATWDEIVVHGDLETPAFLAYYVKDGIVAAAAGLDRDIDTAALTELFRLHRGWTAQALGEQPAKVLRSWPG